MKKNDVFTFTAPNGVEMTGVVTAIISSTKYQTVALCYAQNRLFTFYEHIAYDVETGEAESDYSYGEILVDYAILPNYDAMLVMANFDKEEADILFERNSHAQVVNRVKVMDYSKNADCEI